jgi:uncharacterized protein YbbC (DUF1343 family)
MKKFIIYIFILIISPYSLAQNGNLKSRKIFVGADYLLINNLDLIKNKRVGIITNQTALLASHRVHLVDTLINRKDVNVTALFAPEHGILGDIPAGDTVVNGKFFRTGIPVYSLYGSVRKPTKEMLKDVDVLIYDIQDVGARFCTYISTLFYTLQAAAENNIPIIVLDRPDPITGVNVDGPVLDEEFSSFVGIAPIPIQYGMTPGELATMFNERGMIGKNLKAKLTVIKMKYWERGLYYDMCKIYWMRPSPNIFYIVTAIIYPGTCLLEGTNISEGRGTSYPYQLIGAPFINSKELAKELNKLKISGIEVTPRDFTPKDISNIVINPKYKDQLCHGVKITVSNRYKFDAVKLGIKLIYVLHKLYPKEFKFNAEKFDRLAGNKVIREQILLKNTPDKIISAWQKDLNKFKELRKKYLLY